MDVRDGNGRDGDLPGQAGSLWNLTAPSRPSFPRLGADTSVDVAIVGAGIVGLTTALLLKRAGRSVAVVEARRVGAQVTGNSTAKISSQHGLAYADLIDRHGMAKAQAYAKANQQAIEQIAAIVGDLGDACDFERKPSYAFSRTGKDIEAIREEGDAAARLGLPSVYVTEAPIGVPVAGALKFENQAQFHPRKYQIGRAHV